MIAWGAVLFVGLASYACRVVPLMLAERVGIGPRAEEALRFAGIGAMGALFVGSVTNPTMAGQTIATLAS